MACLTMSPVLFLSAKLWDSAYEPLFGYWGTFATLRALCSYLSTFRYGIFPSYGEEPCYRSGENNITLLTQPAQLVSLSNFDYTYAYFA
jgi:hypothetical protein